MGSLTPRLGQRSAWQEKLFEILEFQEEFRSRTKSKDSDRKIKKNLNLRIVADEGGKKTYFR